ncbi:MAG TPA: hypothetical protein VGB30_08410 [bacterium]
MRKADTSCVIKLGPRPGSENHPDNCACGDCCTRILKKISSYDRIVRRSNARWREKVIRLSVYQVNMISMSRELTSLDRLNDLPDKNNNFGQWM